MNADQIQAGLTSLEPAHPFFQAILALVESDIDSEMDMAVAPDLTDSARQFNAGRLAHARDIKRVLIGSVTDAHAAQNPPRKSKSS